MFPHLLFGGLVFSLVGKIFYWEINFWSLLIGAFIGLAPDFLSFLDFGKLSLDKHSHKHRDNLSHSIFFPILTFLAVWRVFHFELAIMISAALLTHPLIDLFGIGWGVKLFYPFSRKNYKLFYKKKILKIFKPHQLLYEENLYGMDDWIKRIYITFDPIGMPKWVGIYEWGTLLIFIFLLFVF